MVCIYCGGKTQIVNSRGSAKKSSVWRRRQCLECENIVTTREQIDLGEALRVQHSSGHLEPFQRDKLFVSVLSSLSHRKTAQSDATALTYTIIEHLLSSGSNGVIEIKSIVNISLRVISSFDPASGVYYRSHYHL